jgi:hypothetical protein
VGSADLEVVDFAQKLLQFLSIHLGPREQLAIQCFLSAHDGLLRGIALQFREEVDRLGCCLVEVENVLIKLPDDICLIGLDGVHQVSEESLHLLLHPALLSHYLAFVALEFSHEVITAWPLPLPLHNLNYLPINHSYSWLIWAGVVRGGWKG